MRTIDEVATTIEAMPSFRRVPGGLRGEGTVDRADLLAAGWQAVDGDADMLAPPDTASKA